MNQSTTHSLLAENKNTELKPDMATHSLKSGIQVAKKDRFLEVHGWHGLRGEFRASLGYKVRLYLKHKNAEICWETRPSKLNLRARKLSVLGQILPKSPDSHGIERLKQRPLGQRDQRRSTRPVECGSFSSEVRLSSLCTKAAVEQSPGEASVLRTARNPLGAKGR